MIEDEGNAEKAVPFIFKYLLIQGDSVTECRFIRRSRAVNTIGGCESNGKREIQTGAAETQR